MRGHSHRANRTHHPNRGKTSRWLNSRLCRHRTAPSRSLHSRLGRDGARSRRWSRGWHWLQRPGLWHGSVGTTQAPHLLLGEGRGEHPDLGLLPLHLDLRFGLSQVGRRLLRQKPRRQSTGLHSLRGEGTRRPAGVLRLRQHAHQLELRVVLPAHLKLPFLQGLRINVQTTNASHWKWHDLPRFLVR